MAFLAANMVLKVAAFTGWMVCGLTWGTSSAAELPVETFFRNYQYNQALLSPDGNYLGVLAPDADRVGLAVIDLQNNAAKWAFADRLADVDSFFWINSNRLAFRLTHAGYAEPGLMAVNRDGSSAVRLIQSGSQFLSLLPGSNQEFLVASFKGAVQADSATLLRFQNVCRMNYFDGTMTVEVKNPGHVISWVLDSQGTVRAGVALNLTRYQVLYRDNAKAPWEKIADYNYDEHGIWPIGFAADDRTLYVKWDGGEDRLAIYTYDPKERKVTGLGFRHAEVDIGQAIFSERHQLLGVRCEVDRPEVFWFEPHRRQWQQAIDRALTNTINRLISSSGDESKAIFLATSDRTPGAYYLMDTKSMRIKKLFELASWIDPGQMASMTPIQYKARDGLTIHGYLTLPRESSGKNLPLIVNPHGGPRTRDVWGFDEEVQFFANRGYAVLRINFRGSIGYGRSFLKAGDREWGLKQQDDITDGVKWAIEQGVADPKRICIYGASYGGFAALTGLAKTPELYRCAISYAGVIDLERTLRMQMDWTLRNPVLRLRIEEADLVDMLGEKKNEKNHWKEISPLTHADQIQVPVLLAYSEYDRRIPIAAAREFASALKKRGKLYDFMVKDNEDHGFHQQGNKIELWKKIDEFLKATMH